MKLPALEAHASEHFTYAELCHCSEAWRRTRVDNSPRQAATYEAIGLLCQDVLEPALAEFGALDLSYGFAGPNLTRLAPARIAPRLDQHAGHELNRAGALICPRLGQAADLQVPGRSSLALARFLVESTPFDRLYIYGDDRPLHVSRGPQNARSIVMLREVRGRLAPRVLSVKDLRAI